jgi:hypothetical protein
MKAKGHGFHWLKWVGVGGIAILLMATDCGGGPTLVATPYFTLELDGVGTPMLPGGEKQVDVIVIPENDFSGAVTLDITGLPTGVSASFSLSPVVTTSTLTLSAATSVAKGSYPITVIGTSGDLNDTADFTLIISEEPIEGTGALAFSTDLPIPFNGQGHITVSNSAGFSETLPTLQVLSNLEPGVYTITVHEVYICEDTYIGAPASFNVEVTENFTRSVAVSYILNTNLVAQRFSARAVRLYTDSSTTTGLFDFIVYEDKLSIYGCISNDSPGHFSEDNAERFIEIRQGNAKDYFMGSGVSVVTGIQSKWMPEQRIDVFGVYNISEVESTALENGESYLVFYERFGGFDQPYGYMVGQIDITDANGNPVETRAVGGDLIFTVDRSGLPPDATILLAVDGPLDMLERATVDELSELRYVKESTNLINIYSFDYTLSPASLIEGYAFHISKPVAQVRPNQVERIDVSFVRSGDLRVEIYGITQESAGSFDLVIQGPSGYIKERTDAFNIINNGPLVFNDGVAPGEYVITAPDLVIDNVTYSATISSSIVVEQDQTTLATVTYNPQ